MITGIGRPARPTDIDHQPREYRESVLPATVTARVAMDHVVAAARRQCGKETRA